MEKNISKPLPIIGKKYPFFDDGKVSFSRLYIATIKRIIPFEELKNVMIECPCQGFREGWENEPSLTTESLLTLWKEDVEHLNWIFASETDNIIEAEVKDDVVETQYFARTKSGGWFSLGCGRFDVGGRLDVDLERFESLRDDCPKAYITIMKNFSEN